ncbi:hypothetical protein HDU88_001416 [Geranomyces variabilis]|nr:hypothetical protein HDU88_001416 [Geranomyces variabilis]
MTSLTPLRALGARTSSCPLTVESSATVQRWWSSSLPPCRIPPQMAWELTRSRGFCVAAAESVIDSRAIISGPAPNTIEHAKLHIFLASDKLVKCQALTPTCLSNGILRTRTDPRVGHYRKNSVDVDTPDQGRDLSQIASHPVKLG